MAREDDFATRMTGDVTLMAILTGGVFKSGTVGDDGITREVAPTAFDANGYLKPCCLVKQRGNIPDGQFEDETDQTDSAIQIAELWFYQDSGYTAIDLAMARTRVLFRGHQFADSFPLQIANVLDRLRDNGALNGASLARQDWQVNNILGG